MGVRAGGIVCKRLGGFKRPDVNCTAIRQPARGKNSAQVNLLGVDGVPNSFFALKASVGEGGCNHNIICLVVSTKPNKTRFLYKE